MGKLLPTTELEKDAEEAKRRYVSDKFPSHTEVLCSACLHKKFEKLNTIDKEKYNTWKNEWEVFKFH